MGQRDLLFHTQFNSVPVRKRKLGLSPELVCSVVCGYLGLSSRIFSIHVALCRVQSSGHHPRLCLSPGTPYIEIFVCYVVMPIVALCLLCFKISW